MDDLIAFLRARLVEDEAIASAIDEHGEMPSSTPWTAYPHPPGPYDKHQDRDVIMVGAEDDDTAWRVCTVGQWPGAQAVGEHVARHDPARVLREVDAKRRMIDREEEKVRERWRRRADEHRLTFEEWIARWPPETLRLLALPHVHHKDFREEWRP